MFKSFGLQVNLMQLHEDVGLRIINFIEKVEDKLLYRSVGNSWTDLRTLWGLLCNGVVINQGCGLKLHLPESYRAACQGNLSFHSPVAPAHSWLRCFECLNPIRFPFRRNVSALPSKSRIITMPAFYIYNVVYWWTKCYWITFIYQFTQLPLFNRTAFAKLFLPGTETHISYKFYHSSGEQYSLLKGIAFFEYMWFVICDLWFRLHDLFLSSRIINRMELLLCIISLNWHNAQSP